MKINGKIIYGKIGKDTVNAIVALLEKDSDIWIKELKEISMQHDFFHMYVWKIRFCDARIF